MWASLIVSFCFLDLPQTLQIYHKSGNVVCPDFLWLLILRQQRMAIKPAPLPLARLRVWIYYLRGIYFNKRRKWKWEKGDISLLSISVLMESNSALLANLSKRLWELFNTLTTFLGEVKNWLQTIESWTAVKWCHWSKPTKHRLASVLYPYTAKRRDVLGCTSPTTKRFPRPEISLTQYIPTRGSVRQFSHH